MYDYVIGTISELRMMKRLYELGEICVTRSLNVNESSHEDFLINVMELLFNPFDAVCNDECETWFFYHQDFERYYNLCRLLEARTGFAPEDNGWRGIAQDMVDMLWQANVWGNCSGAIEIRTEVGEDRHCVMYIQYEYGSGFWIEDDLVDIMIDIVQFFRNTITVLWEIILNFDYQLFHYALPPKKPTRRKKNGRTNNYKTKAKRQ